MTTDNEPRCTDCEKRICVAGKDCFDAAERHRAIYEDERVLEMHRAASAIEARHYGKENRLAELIHFAKEMGYERLGLAFCIGLSEEAKVVERILSQHFEVRSVCCKACGLKKRHLHLEQLNRENPDEVMCNPAGQAELLNRAGTQMNVICGLCIGHDMVFTEVSEAPVTTFIVKDRVLAHNPVGAVYCRYVRRKLLSKP